MNERSYSRLSPLGRRRARIIRAAEDVICLAIMTGAGFALCGIVYGLQRLCGVA